MVLVDGATMTLKPLRSIMRLHVFDYYSHALLHPCRPAFCSVLHGLLLMKLMTQSPFVHDPAVTYGGASVMSTAPGDRVYYVSALL